MAEPEPDSASSAEDAPVTDWQRRVVGRSLVAARRRSIERGASLIRAAAVLLERSNGEGFTVQEVADEAGQSLRTLYQYFESKDDLLLAVFEEAMRTFARLIREAIADLDDPLDRLAGAIVAAVRLQEHSSTGVDRGLARLRLKLSEVQPELVARSQEPVGALMRELVGAASAAGRIREGDPEPSAYMVTALSASYVMSQTLGNDFPLRTPDARGLATFCLEGLGATIDDGWYDRLTASLRFPEHRLTVDR